MEDMFRIPEEYSGNEDSARRATELIEEIRADIDFELDDSVTDIVRNLPDEYFQRTDRKDQLTHFKGLIASRICELQGELFLPSADHSQIAVIGRRNYRGQLARILAELPGKETRLVGARIYTARSHDFILDIFEFESNDEAPFAPFPAGFAERFAQHCNADVELVAAFLARIRSTHTRTPDMNTLKRLFVARQALDSQQVYLDVQPLGESQSVLVAAVHGQNERMAFRRVTELLSQQSLDIEQAELLILRHDKSPQEPLHARTDKSILMIFKLSNATGQPFDVDAWRATLASPTE